MRIVLTLLLAALIALSVAASTAQAYSYNTGWVCQYLNHPAPVPYGNGLLVCRADYRWWFIGP